MSRVAKVAFSAALLSFLVQPVSLIFADPPAPASDSKPVSRGNNGARHALEHPLPAVKFDATPMSDVMDFLADATSSNFSVDWKALDAAHVAKDMPITLRMSAGRSAAKGAEHGSRPGRRRGCADVLRR